MVNRDYTVALEQVFNGPMDLLLHLVREQEVAIHEVDLHRVITGYLAYLRDLQEIDIELAADFLVMAATLMAIKSRSLLPSENVDLAEELDPRDELIQRLIEYRHFKQAARDLHERFDARAMIHERGFQGVVTPDAGLDLEELSNWDLLAAFSRLMRETLANKQMVITSDERPLRYYVEDLVRTIKDCRTMSLRAIVEDAVRRGGDSKRALIGTFCALLELVKIGAVRAHQPSIEGDIAVTLREDIGDDVESVIKMAEFDDERALDEQQMSATDANAPAAGDATTQDAAPDQSADLEGLAESSEESDDGSEDEARAADFADDRSAAPHALDDDAAHSIESAPVA